MSSEEFPDTIFSALGHSLRRSIVSALIGSPRQFSELMRLCGLDPDHDSGIFVYHLSQLTDLTVVERVGEGYRLTGFGERIAELILALERESALLTDRIPEEREEVRGMSEDVSVQWLKLETMVQRGILYSTEEDFVPKMTDEQSKVYEASKEWSRANEYLLVSKGKRPLAHLKPEIKYRITAGCERVPRPVKVVKSMEPHLGIEDLSLLATEPAHRMNAVTTLLETVEDEGRKIGIKRIWVYKVNADDKAVVSALKDRGFQRFATTYIMTKEL